MRKIVKAEWVSSIQLSTTTRKTEIQSCLGCNVSFHYPQTLETFDDLLEDFKLKKPIDNTDFIDNNNYGENKKMMVSLSWMMFLVWLIVEIGLQVFWQLQGNMDITVSIFLWYCARKEIWKKTVLQTNIFSVFPASIPFQTTAKILRTNVVRTAAKYMPARSLRINKLLFNYAIEMEGFILRLIVAALI